MSTTGREQILSHIPDNVKGNIDTLFKKVDVNKEFVLSSRHDTYMNIPLASLKR